MKMLYGITANGNGHLSRSAQIVSILRERGHHVALVLSGQPGKPVMNADALQPFLRFDGFSFANNSKGRMSAVATILSSRPFRFLGDLLRAVPAEKYDLVVTDYEPLTAWYARLHGIPSVGMCHMYAYLYPEVPAPDSRWYERLTFRWLAPADLMLGIHWHPYHKNVIPPFVQPVDTSEEDEESVLVYLPWEDPQVYLPALAMVKGYRFIVYGNQLNGGCLYGHQSGDTGNLVFRKEDRTGFLEDLGRCASVIANAGFSLASEASSLGKRLLLKPYAGQIEQEHNATEAQRLGLAMRAESLEPEMIDRFLKSPRLAPLAFRNLAPLFVDWLEKGQTTLDIETWSAMWGTRFDRNAQSSSLSCIHTPRHSPRENTSYHPSPVVSTGISRRPAS
jgi:uncharacterized protein (TIGR00661 family)